MINVKFLYLINSDLEVVNIKYFFVLDSSKCYVFVFFCFVFGLMQWGPIICSMHKFPLLSQTSKSTKADWGTPYLTRVILYNNIYEVRLVMCPHNPDSWPL